MLAVQLFLVIYVLRLDGSKVFAAHACVFESFELVSGNFWWGLCHGYSVESHQHIFPGNNGRCIQIHILWLAGHKNTTLPCTFLIVHIPLTKICFEASNGRGHIDRVWIISWYHTITRKRYVLVLISDRSFIMRLKTFENIENSYQSPM